MLTSAHASQVLHHAPPMFGTFAPARGALSPRVQVIDFTDEADPAWIAGRVAKGVRPDCRGLPMVSWMLPGGCAILVDMRDEATFRATWEGQKAPARVEETRTAPARYGHSGEDFARGT